MSVRRKERNEEHHANIMYNARNIISFTILKRALSYSETVKKKVAGITNENTDISLSRLTIAYFLAIASENKVRGIDAERTMRDEV